MIAAKTISNKFLTSSDYSQCEDEIRSCSKPNVIFGSTPVEELADLMDKAVELVDEVEAKCPAISFSKFFITFDGKTDAVL